MKYTINHTYNKVPIVVLGKNYAFLKDSGNDMSRILTMFKRGGAIVSAMRKDKYSDDENIERCEMLEKELRQKGFGYRPSVGGYVQQQGSPDELAVEELSFIVPYRPEQMSEKEFFDTMVDLCKEWEQESVLICLPSFNDGKACYINSNGEVDMSFDKIGLPKNPTYYTKPIKHNTPKFELQTEDSAYKITKVVDVDLYEVAKYYGSFSIYKNPNTSEVRKYDNGWYKAK